MRTRSKNTRIVAAALLAWIGAIAGSARAALVSQSGPFGADTQTLDTATGLVWLDVTESAGYSHTQILAEIQPGGTFEGYHLASAEEVATLFTNAGIDLGAGSAFVAENYTPVVALCALLGVLGNNGNCGAGCTFSFTSGYTGDPPNSPGSFRAANLAYFDNTAGLSPADPHAPIGRAYVNGGSSDGSSSSIGSFLIVPEPPAAGACALLALAAIVRGVPRRRSG